MVCYQQHDGFICSSLPVTNSFPTPMTTPQVTRTGALDMQVCVPEDWTDEQIRVFANEQNLCGTVNGWQIRTDAESLAGAPYRNPCANGNGMIHVTLDA